MKQYMADDFIDADITVKKLTDARHMNSPLWSRPDPVPRKVDGILYFVQGSIEYYFGDETFTAEPGMVLKLPHGVPYCGKKMAPGNVEVYVCDFVSEGDEFLDFPIPFVYYPADGEAVKAEFEHIIGLWNRHTVCSALEAKNAVSRMLCSMAQDVAVNVCGYDDRSRIIKMCEYIRSECKNAGFGVSDAAAHFHISEAHLRRIFKAELHTSPIEYLASARCERAKQRLVSRPDMTVQDIAADCGFANVYYFSNAFKREVGESPTVYRSKRAGLGM